MNFGLLVDAFSALFPLAGVLPWVKDLYPPRRRTLFVALTAILATLLCGLINYDPRTYLQGWVAQRHYSALLLGIGSIVVYLFVHLSIGRGYTRLKRARYAGTVVLLLLLYMTFVASCTLVAQNTKLHATGAWIVVTGRILKSDGEPAGGARMVVTLIDPKTGSTKDMMPVYSGHDGRFLTVVTPIERAAAGAVLIVAGDGREEAVETAAEIPVGNYWEFRLKKVEVR